MKPRFLFAFCISTAPFLFACNKEIRPIDDDQVLVSLSMVSSDIIETDEPFTRAGGEEYTYAVLVSEYNTNTSSYEGYARGVFDSAQNISIRLTKNKKYSFKVALFKNFFSSGEQLNAYYNTDTTYTSANNKFVYDNMIFRQMHGGYSSAFRNNNGVAHSFFMGESFFGQKTDYNATSSSSLTIDLSRTSSFLEVVVNGMTEGKVTSTQMGIDFEIAYPQNSYSTWLTDSEYMQGSSFVKTLYIQYVDSQSKTTQLIYQNFTFLRNYKKTITINLESTTPSSVSNSISLNVSNAELKTDTPETFNCTI